MPTEKDKPSLKFSIEMIEEGKQNKDSLVSQKVRDVIKCSICHRPRCIYVNAKINNDLKTALRDNNEYVCSGALWKILTNTCFLFVVN